MNRVFYNDKWWFDYESKSPKFRERLCLGMKCNIHWDVDKVLLGSSTDWFHLKSSSLDAILYGPYKIIGQIRSNSRLTTVIGIVPFWKFNRLSVKLSWNSDALIANIFGACCSKAFNSWSKKLYYWLTVNAPLIRDER